MNMNAAFLFGLFAQIILYGVYIASSAISVYCVYYTRGKSVTPNKALMGISAVSFVAVTLFCMATVIRVLDAFVGVQAEYPVNAPTYIPRMNTSMLTSFGAYFFVNLTVDCLLIYRLYVIYLQNFQIVIFPVIMIAVYAVSTVSELILLAQARTSDHLHGIGSIDALKTKVWSSLNLSISVVICAYATCLISYRIMRDGRAFRLFGTKNKLGTALYIIIENALLYTFFNFLMLGVFMAGRPVTYFVVGSFIPPLIGINNSLVLIYITRGIADSSQCQTLAVPAPSYSLNFQAAVTPSSGERAAGLLAPETASEQSVEVGGNGAFDGHMRDLKHRDRCAVKSL